MVPEMHGDKEKGDRGKLTNSLTAAAGERREASNQGTGDHGTKPKNLRTHPTVKQSVAMNMKNLRKWEVKFGVVQTVILVGLVTGSMACSFYFGFYSGQDAGFERAYSSGLGNTARIPISVSELPPSASQDAVSEVYARLHDDVAKPDAAGGVAVGGEQLAAIAHSNVELPAAANSGAQPGAEAVDDGASEIADDGLGQIEPQPVIPGGNAKSIDSIAANTTAPTLGNVIGNKDQALSPESKSASGKSNETKAKDQSTASLKSITPKETQAVKEKASGETSSAPAAKVASENKVATQKATNDNNLIRPILPKGWFAQVAAPRKRSDAEAMAKRLKASGFPVMIENANVRGQEYFRVVVGPEQSRAQVDRLVGQLKREKYLEGDPFPRLVK